MKNASRDGRRSWRTGVGIVVCYAALAVALTWPLATRLTSRLPLGTESVSSVPILNAWTVWWNADRAKYGFTEYWHAPIFHPARYTFAFSEAQPTTLIVAPLVAVGGPALAYNLYLLAVLTLNGWAAFGLLRRVDVAVVPATLGGAMAETSPFVHWQLGVLQLTTLCGVLWVIDRLAALRDGEVRGSEKKAGAPAHLGDQRTDESSPPCPRPLLARIFRPSSRLPPVRVRDAVLLGFAAAICYAACNYWGLYLSVLLPLSALPLLWGRWRDWRFWILLALAGTLAAGLVSPILWAQWKAKSEYRWERPESLLIDLSAQPRDYATTPWKPMIPGLDPTRLKDPARPLWMLGPGVVAAGLAGAGAIVGLLTRDRRGWTLFLLLFAGWAFVLSLGPKLEVVDWSRWRLRTDSYAAATGWVPYHAFMKVHPGLALARSPFRFAFFVQVAGALLAVNLLDGMWGGARRLTRDWRPKPRRFIVCAISIIVVVIGLFAAFEIWPGRQHLVALPPTDQAWIRWLRENTDPADPIIDLPFPTGNGVEDYERTAQFMFQQIGHRRPMVQGYSGFFPNDFLTLKDRIPSLPDGELLDDLFRRGVRHVVTTTPEWIGNLERSSRLLLVFRDEDAKVNVYSIIPSPGLLDDRTTSP